MTQPAALPQLRIAVVGGGKIGSTFAFQLAKVGGHDVTVVARRLQLRRTLRPPTSPSSAR